MYRTSAAPLSVSAVGLIALAGFLVLHTPTARATPRAIPRAAASVAAPSTADHADRAPTVATMNDRSASAADLHAQALALQLAGHGQEAAALHRASAALRTAGDSSAERCLELAGTLLTYASDYAEARMAMRAAAAHALDRGDAARAAELTLLAGFVAREQGDAAGVRAFTREARRLANAPSVSVLRRAAILNRIRD